MKKIGIILIIILVIASVTKPSENSFKNFIKSELSVKKDDNILDGILKTGLKIQSSLTNEYEDKIFFSKGSTSLGDKNVDFIGLFGFWFKV